MSRSAGQGHGPAGRQGLARRPPCCGILAQAHACGCPDVRAQAMRDGSAGAPAHTPGAPFPPPSLLPSLKRQRTEKARAHQRHAGGLSQVRGQPLSRLERFLARLHATYQLHQPHERHLGGQAAAGAVPRDAQRSPRGRAWRRTHGRPVTQTRQRWGGGLTHSYTQSVGQGVDCSCNRAVHGAPPLPPASPFPTSKHQPPPPLPPTTPGS